MEKFFDVLGYKVRDAVTGFEGVADSISFDLYGCVQIAVAPTMNMSDPDKSKGRWFDFKRLVKISATPVLDQPVFAAPGSEIGPAEKPARD